MEQLKERMKNKLNLIKQQTKREFQAAVESEVSERQQEPEQASNRTTTVAFSSRNSTDDRIQSPQYIKEVEIDEEGTWDEFSFGTNPDTSERTRELQSHNSGLGSEP